MTAPITLRSNRLAVEIAQPGTVYRRTRFDWTGFITQITLDGKHTYCVPEDYNPNAGTGGIGLCNEFGNEKTVGFVDAKPGDPFPKLGIGLLIRPDDAPYNFFRPYEIAQPFPIHIETGTSQARFTVDPLDCRGYAAREIKTVKVEEDCLLITYQLENTGSRPIITHEYCHNFVGINKQPVGPDYRLHFPYPLKFENISESYRRHLHPLLRNITPGFVLEKLVNRQLNRDILQINGGDIRWKSTPMKSFFCRLLGFSQTSQPQWELMLEASGVGMREYDDFAPSRLPLWGASHVVSPEIYVDINLEPGQSQSWTRRYEFFAS